MLSSIFGVSIPYLLGIDAENSTNLPAHKQHMLNINNILTDLLRNADKLTAQNLSDIKREARNLYEILVWLQYEAERIET